MRKHKSTALWKCAEYHSSHAARLPDAEYAQGNTAALYHIVYKHTGGKIAALGVDKDVNGSMTVFGG